MAIGIGFLLGLIGGGGRLGLVLGLVNVVVMYALFAWLLWPHIWWASSLGLLVEVAEVATMGNMSLTWLGQEAVHHWTTTITGLNTYPLFTAPAIGLICELAYRSWKRGNAWRDKAAA
jgi:hypothetical protein